MNLHATIESARSIGLTRAQLRYLRAIRDLTADGLPTTHRAVACRLEVVPAGVYQMLTRLRRDGLVAFNRGQTRTIRLTDAGREAAELRAVDVRARAGNRHDLAAVEG